ncbi:dihydrofolate synthase / folylpolyglutamate synthase [Lentibacillus persicus]|uniref:tetrahydrofolate synthase n=1 Tax=Lentibacillus persicus TaxID=640948 RepID=A0A1I1TM47_9BACI|nr:folylpolyglutamate synthase/dihydrofolate synthase family protein [Lentibacillus persicus]SFD58258.1 dihydrofolate synthase / folylpolyglutamate synthase [Lentibacillus persicus]
MFEHFSQIELFFHERKQFGVKPGLDRIHKLLNLLGNPQQKVNAIHVAGTNGKGSTISYLKRSLMKSGYQVGVFNSPSIEGLTGHFMLNDKQIPENDFMQYINNTLPSIKKLDSESNHPTEFEIMTAIAFLFFADKADIALIEAGMGGKEDTTNCFDPILSIVTNVEWDHTNFLGRTIESIASHKSGVIKKERPAVIGEMSDKAMNIIIGEAHVKNAPLYVSGKDFDYKILTSTVQRQTFNFRFPEGPRMHLTLKAAGDHQIKNASLAVMALSILIDEGFNLDWVQCMEGLADVKIPGRFEQIHSNPPIILDAAHNPAGVQAFTDTITDNIPNMNRHLIFAVFKDKDYRQMLDHLQPHFTSIILTTFDHPRAAEPQDLKKCCSHSNTRIVSNWHEAVEQIELNHHNACYCITGSLHFIAIVRKYFIEMMKLGHNL